MKKIKRIGAVILNEDKNKVLLVHQKKGNYWVFPKGGSEENEDEIKTLKREVWEETGVNKFLIDKDFKTQISYKFKGPEDWIYVQIIYYLICTKQFARLIRPKELFALKWCSFKEAEKYLKFKNQKDLLKKVIKYLHGK